MIEFQIVAYNLFYYSNIMVTLNIGTTPIVWLFIHDLIHKIPVQNAVKIHNGF